MLPYDSIFFPSFAYLLHTFSLTFFFSGAGIHFDCSELRTYQLLHILISLLCGSNYPNIFIQMFKFYLLIFSKYCFDYYYYCIYYLLKFSNFGILL